MIDAQQAVFSSLFATIRYWRSTEAILLDAAGDPGDALSYAVPKITRKQRCVLSQFAVNQTFYHG